MSMSNSLITTSILNIRLRFFFWIPKFLKEHTGCFSASKLMQYSETVLSTLVEMNDPAFKIILFKYQCLPDRNLLWHDRL